MATSSLPQVQNEQVGDGFVLFKRQLQFLLLFLLLDRGVAIDVAVDMAVDGVVGRRHVLGVRFHRIFINVAERLLFTFQLDVGLLNSNDRFVEKSERFFDVFGSNFILVELAKQPYLTQS